MQLYRGQNRPNYNYRGGRSRGYDNNVNVQNNSRTFFRGGYNQGQQRNNYNQDYNTYRGGMTYRGNGNQRGHYNPNYRARGYYSYGQNTNQDFLTLQNMLENWMAQNNPRPINNHA